MGGVFMRKKEQQLDLAIWLVIQLSHTVVEFAAKPLEFASDR